MTSKLEQKFYDTFGIEPFCDLPCKKRGVECTDNTYCGNKYPEITAEKLLQMICIWNYTMPCIDDCIIPIDYLGLKSVVLDTMIRYSEIEYKFDVESLKYQIQQLFKD